MKKEYEDWFYTKYECLPYEKHHGVGFTNVDELLCLRNEFSGKIMEGGKLEISKEERKELKEELNKILEQVTYHKLAEADGKMSDDMQKLNQKIPILIYTG